MKNIPQHEPHFDECEVRAVYDYMRSGGWVMEFGKTKELEDMLADFTGSKYATMTTNGTVALTLALLALGLKRGDEVLVPDITMIATPNSASLVGIKPVLVDVEPETLCMDMESAEKALTGKTRAMIYVSLHGRSGNMQSVQRFCRKHGLCLIEDAAQSLGSTWRGKHLGTLGDIGILSFSVPKIITTGQGGALLTNNKKVRGKLLKLKNFGRESGGNDIHDEIGWNFKFTDIQAVIGIEQMRKLKSRVKRKKEIWRRYERNLHTMPQVGLMTTNLKDTTPWFIDIYVDNPDRLAEYLMKQGIGTRRIYPPIHTQEIYSSRRRFPVAEKFSARGLWLPSGSELTNSEIDMVVRAIKSYYSSK